MRTPERDASDAGLIPSLRFEFKPLGAGNLHDGVLAATASFSLAVPTGVGTGLRKARSMGFRR